MPDAYPVQFDHVSLAFDEQVVLRDISFAVSAGTALVILGKADRAASPDPRIKRFIKDAADPPWLSPRSAGYQPVRDHFVRQEVQT